MDSNGRAVDTLEEEDRLRAEAARGLERRRRKMMSPEHRLARFLGRPVQCHSHCHQYSHLPRVG